MVTIANLQYGWTLFINPIDQKYHWGRAAIQVAFTIYIVTETWVVPFAGYLIDRFGPRVMVCGSGALVATCPSRKSYPRVLMMQPGQNGRDGNGPTSLDRSR
jgi:OFA family oxalate/formate antiporter-like MFS transporter